MNNVFLMSLREFAGNSYLHLGAEVHDGFHEDQEHIQRKRYFPALIYTVSCILN